jgi:hypothetical protein
MNTHQAASSSVRRCARREPRPSDSSACSAREASATVKLPHSRQVLVSGCLFAVDTAGSSCGAMTFNLWGSIWRESGAGSAASAGAP